MPNIEISDSMYNDFLMLAEEADMEINDYIYKVLQTPIDYHYNKFKKDERCGTCNQTLTYGAGIDARALRWMLALHLLCKEDLARGGLGYAHYTQAQELVKNMFAEQGKEKESFTGYSIIGSPPYNLVEQYRKPITVGNPDGKEEESGLWRLSKIGFLFWNGNVAVYNKIIVLKGDKEGYALPAKAKKVFINEVKDFNHKESIPIYQKWKDIKKI